MTKAKCWSCSAGTRGKNRVRAYEEPSGLLLVEFWEREDGSERACRKRLSLGHRDRQRAAKEVLAIAARLAVDPAHSAGEITLGSLFDIYGTEVTPRKGNAKQLHDRRTAEMFLTLWDRDRAAETLNLRDWEQFVELRRCGTIGPSKTSRPVRNRQIEYDLKWLRGVFNWATKAGPDGKPLLARNPLAGYPLPRERNPARPVLTEEQYRALLPAARHINWRLELALVLANETGHRLGAVRHLRWSDVDLEGGRIRWRALHDKVGFDHETPMSIPLQEALSQARRRGATIGDAWVLPAVRDASRACAKGTLDKWFAQAAKEAGVELTRGARWHSLRRKFATELQDMTLRNLCHLGGWKDPKTILTCYQHPDEEAMREGLTQRRTYGCRSLSVQAFSTDSTANCTG